MMLKNGCLVRPFFINNRFKSNAELTRYSSQHLPHLSHLHPPAASPGIHLSPN